MSYSKGFQKGKLELPEGKETKKSDKDVYDLMDLADEEQIRLEFTGRFVDEYVYSFPVETKEGKVFVTGLSYAGTKEMVKEINVRGKARYTATDIPPVVEEHDTYWLAKVQCEDKKTGLKIWGVKKQNKRKTGGQIDEHAETIAVSKAQRNGLQGLIPKSLVNKFIKEYLKKIGAIKQLKPEPQEDKAIKEAVKAVDDREIFGNGILNLASRLAVITRIKTGEIILREMKALFGKEHLADLGIEQLKILHQTLTAKLDKISKPSVGVQSAQQTIESFYNDNTKV